MDNIKDISLSSADQIYEKVSPKTDNFSFADTLGGFVVNNEFSHGYRQFQAKKNNEQSNIWETLSSIGQEFGDVMVQNVRNYIDNISNVDTCKVQSLKSMLNLIDMDYKLLEKTEYYPLGITKLIDILSINRKYLLDNRYIKDDFIQYLSNDNIISLSCLSSTSQISTENYIYELSSLDGYIGKIFYNFIYDTLNDSIHTVSGEIYTRNTLSSGTMYGKNKVPETYESIEVKRKAYGIDSSFDYVKIADEINIGNDTLENYQGYRKELIQDVIDERSKAYSETSRYYKNSRYFYYRQKKVVEMAEFVDNTYVRLSSLLNNEVYDYDANYIVMGNEENRQYSLVIKDDGNVIIDENMVKNVSIILVNMVSYIRKLRERTKIHTRQVFMKGTNNLLKYTVGQFLMDYFEHMKGNIDNGTSDISQEERNKFDDIYEKVQTLGRKLGFDEGIKVQEYYDNTEYMNLSTETSHLGINGNKVNGRFFENYFQEENDRLYAKDPMHFSTEQIDDFYLNSLSLKNHFTGSLNESQTEEEIHQKFYRFLQVLFDIGANTSYYDENLSVFGAKLSDGKYSTLRYEDLNEIVQIRNEISNLKEYIGGYEFDGETTLQEQETNFLEKYETCLQNEYLSSVSSMYETYHPEVESLSSQKDKLRNKLEDYLSGEYFYYFSKSDNEYCLDENGNYNLDYFLNNDEHPYDVCLYDRYKDAYDWITEDGHCRNWPILCASMTLKNEYNYLKSDIKNNVITPLQQYGYTPPTTENLGTILENCDEFTKTKIQNRLSYLTNALQNMRQQSQELKTQHDRIANSVDQIIAQNPGLEQGYAFKYVGRNDSGDYLGTYRTGKDTDKNTIYDKFSGKFFESKDKKGIYDIIKFNISLNGSLENRISELIGVFDGIYYGDSGSYNSGTNEALKSARTNLSSIQSSIDSIVAQIKEIFCKNDNEITNITSTGSSSATILEKINILIQYLGTKISEQDYESDTKMVEYRGYEDVIRQYTEKYEPLKAKYDNLFSVFSEYLTTFTENNPSYTTFSDTNLQKVYDYTIQQDNLKLEIIKKWFQEFGNEYDELIEQFNELKFNLHENEIYFVNSNKQEYIYEFTSQIIEECIYDLEDSLIEDTNTRTIIGNIKILEKVSYCQYKLFGRIIELYYEHLKSNIGTYDDVTGRTEFEDDFMALKDRTWDDVTVELNDYLDYTDNTNYVQSKKIFRSYSGLVKAYDEQEGKEINVATDPYYNHKNLTHPSYQIHPFLWNFVEKMESESLTDYIVKYITNIDTEELENPLVQSKIDEYLGEFGNLVDKWNKDINDYSGWTTRYEYSDHVCQYTGLSSEVVDYDGAFYPKALEDYRNGNKTIESLSVYYSHLRYEDDQTKKKETDKNLSDNYDRIVEMTNDAELSNVYDIFRYQIDSFGNMYILYKKYGEENPDYGEKLNTEGELWIRLADTPIAFPAERVLNSESYARFFGNQGIGIKDINISGDKSRIIIVFYNRENGINEEQFISLYIDYNTSKCGIGDLRLTTYSVNDNTKTPSMEYPKSNEEKRFTYVGQYNYQNSSNRTDVLFIERNNNREITDKPNLYIYRCDTKKANPDRKVETLTDIENINSVSKVQNPPIAYWCDYNGTNFIDIAFVTDENRPSAVTYKGISVDMQENPKGNQYDDFTSKEMNSHDRLNQNITLQRIELHDQINYKTCIRLNINTDIGYVPTYPGYLSSQCLDMSRELGQNYQSMELMGKSKNIDELIDGVNKNINPFLTKEDILSGCLYGRVYEDFSISSDRSLNIYSNESMFTNMKNTDEFEYDEKLKCFNWTLKLKGYTFNDISCLKMIMYKVNSTGRNPYIVEDLSNIIDIEQSTEISTYYGQESQFDDNEYEFQYKGNKIKVVGTLNGVDQVNKFFSNRIDNIEDIKYYNHLKGEIPTLKIMFMHSLQTDPIINKDTVRVVIINTHDFRQFEAYHFLDSNGFIKESGSGPYYTNDNGSITYLSSIQLSSYQDMNEIYAFATSKRLQFKYSDEDVFKQDDINHYFPCLNVKIPYSAGNFFNENYERSRSFIKDNDTVRIYDKNNIFRVKAQESESVSALNGVTFVGDEYVDELRVYEDYLSTNYSENDPQMYEYVHLYVDSENGITSSEISVPTSACCSVTIDYENGTDEFTKWMELSGLKCLKGEQSTDGAFTTEGFNFNDLSSSEKEQFIKELGRFMVLNFSYKRSTEGIDLYVNYQNFINTPYIRIEAEKVYQDKIDGTYAIVKQGQSNDINIVIQMCAYQGNRIYAVKNITVATYRIQNISDDKPKFILTRIKDVDDSNFGADKNSYGIIKAEQKTVYLSDYSENFDYNVNLNANFTIDGTVSCLMTYDSSTLSAISEQSMISKESDGCFKLYFSQYDRKRKITFGVKHPITPRIQKILQKPRPVVIRNIGYSTNNQISASNGYIKIYTR